MLLESVAMGFKRLLHLHSVDFFGLVGPVFRLLGIPLISLVFSRSLLEVICSVNLATFLVVIELVIFDSVDWMGSQWRCRLESP